MAPRAWSQMESLKWAYFYSFTINSYILTLRGSFGTSQLAHSVVLTVLSSLWGSVLLNNCQPVILYALSFVMLLWILMSLVFCILINIWLFLHNNRVTGMKLWTALMTWTCVRLFSGESMLMVLKSPLPSSKGLFSLVSRVRYLFLSIKLHLQKTVTISLTVTYNFML